VAQLGIDLSPSQVQGRSTTILESLARIKLDDPRLDDTALRGSAAKDARVFRVQSKSQSRPVPHGARVLTPEQLDDLRTSPEMEVAS
jgi:hypothetical protein